MHSIVTPLPMGLFFVEGAVILFLSLHYGPVAARGTQKVRHTAWLVL